MSHGKPDPIIYVEPEEAERQKELRMREVHIRVVPAVRTEPGAGPHLVPDTVTAAHA